MRWYERMRVEDPEFYGRLFPQGDADVESFLARVEDQQRRYGIPAKCEHVPTLLHVARVIST